MLYRITHRTTYSYVDPVALCHNKAHLLPRDTQNQRVISSRIVVNPKPAVLSQRLDFYGNNVTFFALQEPHTTLEVVVSSEVAVVPAAIPASTPGWATARDLLAADLSPAGLEAAEFRHRSPHVTPAPAFAEYAEPSFPGGEPLLGCVLNLNRRIHADFKYEPLSTTVSTPVEDVLKSRKGVCQDFAHLMIACLRSMGLAARYVSGYLRTLPPPGKARLVGADASHAWVAVYCPGYGWIDFDPTNDTIPREDHITLAWGRDYDDVSPLRGVILGGSQQALRVSVDVEPMAATAVGHG